MASLYRAATSYEAFEDYVKLAEKRINTAEQLELADDHVYAAFPQDSHQLIVRS